VGAVSVILYDSTMEDGARLDALSLLMKGETLPAGTAWAGIPAACQDRAGPGRLAEPRGPGAPASTPGERLRKEHERSTTESAA